MKKWLETGGNENMKFSLKQEPKKPKRHQPLHGKGKLVLSLIIPKDAATDVSLPRMQGGPQTGYGGKEVRPHASCALTFTQPTA
jgi:hypothetical protein